MVLGVFLVRLDFDCLLACWGGINVSLWWGGVWGVVWLGCGTGCAGRHGGAPASTYVGASHTPDDDLAGSVSFLFIELSRFSFMFCLLVLTQPRHGKEGGAEDRRSIFFFKVCASVEHGHIVG